MLDLLSYEKTKELETNMQNDAYSLEIRLSAKEISDRIIQNILYICSADAIEVQESGHTWLRELSRRAKKTKKISPDLKELLQKAIKTAAGGETVSFDVTNTINKALEEKGILQLFPEEILDKIRSKITVFSDKLLEVVEQVSLKNIAIFFGDEELVKELSEYKNRPGEILEEFNKEAAEVMEEFGEYLKKADPVKSMLGSLFGLEYLGKDANKS